MFVCGPRAGAGVNKGSKSSTSCVLKVPELEKRTESQTYHQASQSLVCSSPLELRVGRGEGSKEGPTALPIAWGGLERGTG